MVQRDFADIGIKLLGIFALMYALRYVPTLVQALNMDPHKDMPIAIAASLLGVFLYLGLGRWLITRSKYLSRRLFPFEAQTGTHINSESFQAVLFSAVGVYVLCESIPEAVRTFTHYMFSDRSGADDYARKFLVLEYVAQNWAALLALVAQLLLGIVLFFGSKGLAAYWHRLRPMSRLPDDAG